MRHKPALGQTSLFNDEPVLSPPTDTDDTVPNQSIEEHKFDKGSVKRQTKMGDLWLIGRHKLLCGNSAKMAELDTLLKGKTVQLVHTDPPYNVKVQPQSKDKSKATARKLEGDFLSKAKFVTLLHHWFINFARVLDSGRSFYVWGGYSNVTNYPGALRVAGLFFSQAIIWNKTISVFTRKDFMGQHEWCFYGWKEKAGFPHQFFGPNNVTDVWTIPNVARQSMIHLTEKPVEIPARAINYSSEPGEIVLDLFGGSGSTLVAAEELDRTCYLMEIDPWYCDVIIDRCKRMGLEVRRA